VNYFFDSSALIKLYHPEPGSQQVAAMFGGPDRRIVISRLAGVELHSALALKTRTGHPDSERSAALRIRFPDDVASGAIALVAVGEFHYPAAERLIIRYGDRQGLRTLHATLAVITNQSGFGVRLFAQPHLSFAERAIQRVNVYRYK